MWTLIIIAFGFDGGAYVHHINFKSKQYCLDAAKNSSSQIGIGKSQWFCVEGVITKDQPHE